MNNYSSLRTVAKVFKVMAWIGVVIGVIMIFMTLPSAQYEPMGVLIVIGTTAIYTFLGFVFCFAIAELILLVINAAENLENIKDNVYYLAAKKEEEADKIS